MNQQVQKLQEYIPQQKTKTSFSFSEEEPVDSLSPQIEKLEEDWFTNILDTIFNYIDKLLSTILTVFSILVIRKQLEENENGKTKKSKA
jgi:predicted PurR-regulated permease PerM